MNNHLHKTLALGIAFAAAIPGSAQVLRHFQSQAANHHVHRAISPLSDARLTAVLPGADPCVTDAQRTEARERIARNKAAILEKNPHAFSESKGGAALFVLPIQAREDYDDYGYYTINFLVDHNPAYNAHTDYHCGSRSYDWPGGNHEGTDFILWPFPWKYMEEEVMEIVAAAPGTIVDKRDGHYDLNCANDGNPNWNGLIVEHFDGSQAWYWHFKNGAITDKEVGEVVEAGEYLGAAGSSGSSNWPHLHFEVYDAQDQLVDPWEGACNSMNDFGLWQEQQPYNVPWINHLATHPSLDYYNGCAEVENTFEGNDFFPGDSLVFRLFYRDLLNGATTHIIMTAPDGSQYYNWEFVSPWSDFATADAYWVFLPGSSWEFGTYVLSATLDGNTFETEFNLLDPVSVDQAQKGEFRIVPNPTSDVLRIVGPDLEQSKYEVRDITGRRIAQGALATGSDRGIDVRAYAPGVYFLILQGSTVSGVRRFVVE